MVIVDERGGSAGLEGAKKRLNALRSRGVDASLGHLEYGDYGITGNGPDGSTVLVGVELKTTRDAINSLRSSRLIGHQVPGMVGADGNTGMYDRTWLVTEGIWREAQDGDFEYYAGSWQTVSAGKRPIQMQDLESWILSTITAGGMQYWHCALQTDTARFIRNLDRYWSKPYDEHEPHVIYRPPPDRALFRTPSDFVVMIAAIPKVGWVRAKAIERACPDEMDQLMSMSTRQLQEIEGIGPGIAEIILKTLHKRRRNNG